MSRESRAGGMLLRLFLGFALMAIIGAGALYFSLAQPYQGFSNPVILDFPKGTNTSEMAAELANAGVIRSSWQFLMARALRSSARLQAGEYQFTQPASVWTVFDRITRGDVFFYELVVTEGANIFDIAENVNRLGFLKGSDFLVAARNPALIRDLAPQAPTLEGYLFPSTYRVTRNANEQQLCRMMTDLFRKKWQELARAPDARPMNEVVTLASLIEKETAVPDERPLVASVYANRLRRGMALDCDPTTIYAALLEARYRGAIYKSDLESVNAYNTYRHAGLPPGPIANPGLASLKAALAPASTDYLYFVAKADGSGGHHFSTSISEHGRAVVDYRRSLQKTVQAPPPPPVAPERRSRHRRSGSTP